MTDLTTEELTLEERKSREILEEKSKELHRQLLEDDGSDYILNSISQLTDMELKYSQYLRMTEGAYEDVQKVCLVKVRARQDDLEKSFGSPVVNVYGTGYFIPIVGIFLSRETRKKIGYDNLVSRRRGGRYDLSHLPYNVQKEYAFNLAIPAQSGLFVPKKGVITEWVNSVRCLKFLEEGL